MRLKILDLTSDQNQGTIGAFSRHHFHPNTHECYGLLPLWRFSAAANGPSCIPGVIYAIDRSGPNRRWKGRAESSHGSRRRDYPSGRGVALHQRYSWLLQVPWCISQSKVSIPSRNHDTNLEKGLAKVEERVVQRWREMLILERRSRVGPYQGS